MFLEHFKKHRYFRFIANKYILIFLTFLIWIFFFDENSYLVHRKYNKEIKNLKHSIEFYQTKVAADKNTIKYLEDSSQLERFAREKYLMKKENEDIYIIKFDTLKK